MSRRAYKTSIPAATVEVIEAEDGRLLVNGTGLDLWCDTQTGTLAQGGRIGIHAAVECGRKNGLAGVFLRPGQGLSRRLAGVERRGQTAARLPALLRQ